MGRKDENSRAKCNTLGLGSGAGGTVTVLYSTVLLLVPVYLGFTEGRTNLGQVILVDTNQRAITAQLSRVDIIVCFG